MIFKSLITLLSFAWALLPAVAFAHTGVGPDTDFSDGLEHPFAGVDHIFGMVVVGVLAYHRLAKWAFWQIPLGFMGVMALGVVLGLAGIHMPYLVIGIAIAIMAVGAKFALKLRPSAAAALGLIAFFALFHGHMHGAALPKQMGDIAYVAGFILGTALLYLAGISMAVMISRAGAGSISAGTGILEGPGIGAGVMIVRVLAAAIFIIGAMVISGTF